MIGSAVSTVGYGGGYGGCTGPQVRDHCGHTGGGVPPPPLAEATAGMVSDAASATATRMRRFMVPPIWVLDTVTYPWLDNDMPATTTHYVAKATETEAAMSATYTTTVTEVEAGIFGGGTYRIECTCGERVTYAGQAFTQIEAERHQRWHQAAGK